MRTILVTAYSPRIDTGRGLRVYGVVAALARLGEVEVAYRPFGDEPAAAYERLDGVTLTRLDEGHKLRRGLAYAIARGRGAPDGTARGVTPALARVARQAPADVRVIADGTIAAAALMGVARRRPVIYCAHNLESGYRHTLSDETASPRTLARFERRIIASAAETWMVSTADARGAAELSPGATIRIVPNVVDVRAIEPVKPLAGARRVLFVADLNYSPNRVALEFLRNEVRPLLRAVMPGAEIVVVGRGSEARDEAEGLRMLGRVDDLRAEYAAAGAVVVPLFQSGGSPLKFVEALAYGVPTIATPKAAAGLDVEAGVHYHEASTAAEFADGIARALRGEASALGVAGRELALARYSIEALAECLNAPSARHHAGDDPARTTA